MGEYTEEDSRGSMPDQSFDGVESGGGVEKPLRTRGRPGEPWGAWQSLECLCGGGVHSVSHLLQPGRCQPGALGGYALNISSVAFLLAMGVLTFCYSAAAAVLLTLALLRPSSDLTYRLPRPLLISDFIFLLLPLCCLVRGCG